MEPSTYIGEPESLEEWLRKLGAFPGDGWLLISSEEKHLSKNTLCYPLVHRGVDLSAEEQNQVDLAIDQSQYQEFLSQDLLEGILANLTVQNENYSQPTLIQAIEYFWLNDAFMSLVDA